MTSQEIKIDIMGLEEYFSKLKRYPHCIPRNVREWSEFARKYEVMISEEFLELVDFSSPTLKATKIKENWNKLLQKFNIEEFKYSPIEYCADIDEKSTYEKIMYEHGFDMSKIRESINLVSYIRSCTLLPEDFLNGKLKVRLPKHICGKLNASHVSTIDNLSFEGFPETIGGDLILNLNSIENFIGCPKIVKGNFHAIAVNLQSLKSFDGMPKTIFGNVDIRQYSDCEDFKKLQGFTKTIGGYCKIINIRLANLVGGPKYIGRDFMIKATEFLFPIKTVEGNPEVVNGNVYIDDVEDLSVEWNGIVFGNFCCNTYIKNENVGYKILNNG